ncbi:MAG: hypothetical protein EXS08_15120 [Planctomycetes bacterium]|nr:hypothetical protein [Planctomycetota bacterium]
MLTSLMSACAMVRNQPAVGKGPNFEVSFATAQEALLEKGYTIAMADKDTGQLQTEKRTNKDWWWVIAAKVAQDGQVEFLASGSERVQKADKIHPRVLRFAEIVKEVFQKLVDGKRLHARVERAEC